MIRAFAHGAMELHGGPIELFLVPASVLFLFVLLLFFCR